MPIDNLLFSLTAGEKGFRSMGKKRLEKVTLSYLRSQMTMLEKRKIATIDNKKIQPQEGRHLSFTIIRKYGQEIFKNKIKYRAIEKSNKALEFMVVTLFLL